MDNYGCNCLTEFFFSPRLDSPAGSRLRDELDGLDDTADDLVLDAGILSLRVLADGDDVDAVVQRLVAVDGHARTNVGEEVEL